MKYLISFIVVILLVLLAVSWYNNSQQSERDQKIQQGMDKLQTQITGIRTTAQGREGRDTVYNHEIVKITNNFKTIYDKTNNMAFTDFDPVIDSLLAGHRKTPVERNYQVSR